MFVVESIKRLKWYEAVLWIVSVLVIVVSFVLFKNREYMNLAASVVGVTALIFIAKGDVLGQILTVIFSIFYAIVSYQFRYFGEMITYLGMTAPIALISVITWIKNPYRKGEVKVSHTTPKLWIALILSALVVTTLFYFILKHYDTPNLLYSTISITTSFLAASLAMFRSAYYALAYAANDIVLVILWVLATMEEFSFLPMVLCFIIFFINDMYGFINWQKMKKNQQE